MGLVDFTDLDWAGNTSKRKSTSSGCFGLGSTIVSWFSQKQKSIALSSTKAEYMEVSQASCEAL